MLIIKHYNKTILLSALTVILSLCNFNTEGRVEQIFPHVDKIIHFLMYFGITSTLLFERYFRTCRMGKNVFLMNLYPLMLGGSLEIIQNLFTVYRSGDWYDFIADITGILAANVFFLLLKDVKFFRKIVRYPF